MADGFAEVRPRVWRAQPRQERALLMVLDTSEHSPDEIFYGGAAGGGKTDTELIACIVICETYPGARCLYLRRTYPQLESKPIPRSKELLLGHAGWRYNESKHRWRHTNGSLIQFGSLSNRGDETDYLGSEWDLICWDELTEFPEEAQYELLLTRNRVAPRNNRPGLFSRDGRHKWRPKVIASSNPGGLGHAWVCKRWNLPNYPEVVWEAPRSPALAEAGLPARRRVFIPARLEDNQALLEADPTYRAKLLDLPDNLRQMYYEGRWDVFAGMAFEEFDRNMHVCKPFPIPHWWRRWRANDPGYTDPFVWYWLATDESGENVYIYREFTRVPSDPKLTYSEQARRVTELSLLGTEVPGRPLEAEPDPETGEPRPVPEKIDFTVTGMDAFIQDPETGKAMTYYYAQGGVTGCIEPVHGDGARANMRATYHEYLKVGAGGDGRRAAKLHIFATCTQLVETLPLQVTDAKYPEKVAESPIDHWYQGAGYGLQAWHATRSRAPAPVLGPVATAKQRLMKSLAAQRRRAQLM